MTPAQLEEAVRRRFNASTSAFWSQDEIFKLFYEAEMILAKEALAIESKDTSITTVASTQGYAYPTRVFAIKRVEYDGQKLQHIDMREDDRLTLSNSTTTTTGTPQYYYTWDDYIYLRPIPDGTKTLTIYAYSEPVLLTTSSTSFSVPSRFHMEMADYAAIIMSLKDKDEGMANFYQARWDRAVDRARAWSNKNKRTDAFAVVKDEDALSETILGAV